MKDLIIAKKYLTPSCQGFLMSTDIWSTPCRFSFDCIEISQIAYVFNSIIYQYYNEREFLFGEEIYLKI